MGDYTQLVPWACPFFMTQLPSGAEKAVFPLRLGFVVVAVFCPSALCVHTFGFLGEQLKAAFAKADWTVITRIVVNIAGVRIPTANMVIFCCIISYSGNLLFVSSNKLFPSEYDGKT